jgi:hypothetical protein
VNPPTQTAEPAQAARQTLADWLGSCSNLLDLVKDGALKDLDSQQLVEFIRQMEECRNTISVNERGHLAQDLPSRRIRASIVEVHNQFLDQLLRLCEDEVSRRLRSRARADRPMTGDRRADRTGQGFSPAPSAQPRTATARASARSVRSQVKSGSSRPKCP